MKFFHAVVITGLLSSIILGQNIKAPDTLISSETAQATAKSLGVEVFKILPRGLYKDPPSASKDEDNPIGIREGGAFYSFTSRSHSYNAPTPQIMLERGDFAVGFAGANYGMIVDIGRYPFSGDYSEIPEFIFMNSYKPPKYEKEIRAESFYNKRIEGILYRSRSVPAILGHTYLLRAISFSEADILVAFTVLEYNEDGSMEIAWKKMADFGKRIMLYLPDRELKAAIDQIIAAKGINLSVDVKDNIMIWRGSPSNEEIHKLYQALKENNIQIRGEARSTPK